MHKDEQRAIEQAIREDILIDIAELPQEMKVLFRNNTNNLLNSNLNAKLQWLTSIWGERDEIRKNQGLPARHEDLISSLFLIRDNIRRKIKWDENFAAL